MEVKNGQSRSFFSIHISATFLQHMVIGGLPLLLISIINQDPAFNGGFGEFSVSDILALLYTSVFGSAISYGVYFNSATKGSFLAFQSSLLLTFVMLNLQFLFHHAISSIGHTIKFSLSRTFSLVHYVFYTAFQVA